MHFLILSVICSVLVSVLLKLAPRRGVDIAQAVTWNYLAASVLSLVLLKPSLASLQSGHTPWLALLGLAVALPGIFLVLARAVEGAGIVRSDVAQRLSLLLVLARRTNRLVSRMRVLSSAAVAALVYGGISGSISSTYTFAPWFSRTLIAPATNSSSLLECERKVDPDRDREAAVLRRLVARSGPMSRAKRLKSSRDAYIAIPDYARLSMRVRIEDTSFRISATEMSARASSVSSSSVGLMAFRPVESIAEPMRLSDI